ncbi:MAG TPA: ABC transporter substrate-binding protein [Candidatus Copromonas faecavium]|uniref:ABC transporter substrate-binding protein n=1 Tax=Candidatus Copromonas faecavium (nom. illeg.) TaxID=2840740 RepID=A0A9D1D650_9FIRM|nr:ABC transporter substrate-binding protein [Candidatus Copromonas faecavium]
MRKILPVMLAAALGLSVLSGCSSSTTETAAETTGAAASESQTEAASEGSAAAETDTEGSSAEEAEGSSEAQEDTQAESSEDGETVIRVGGLKGPTTMGLVKLMEDAENGEAQNNYEFTMVTAADELTAMVAGNQVDIALLPANVASVLYNRTDKQVSVVDINTLGVLYLVSGDTSITSIDQLAGKTVYLTGKGTTPEYAFNYILSAAGLTAEDVTLDFRSEATEVAAILAENPDAIGLLPQPFVTVALSQNDSLSIIMDLTEEWDKLQAEDSGSRLVTGVTIVNNEFLAEHPDLVNTFLEEHEASALYTDNHPAEDAELIAAAGIVAQAPIAEKALPYCNITCITGEDMKGALSGYLEVLYEQNPESVGGTLPDDAFYYIP